MQSPKEEFIAGSREVAPSLVGTMPFGVVVGVAAVASGLTPFEGVALSVIGFSGIAQLIALALESRRRSRRHERTGDMLPPASATANFPPGVPGNLPPGPR